MSEDYPITLILPRPMHVNNYTDGSFFNHDCITLGAGKYQAKRVVISQQSCLVIILEEPRQTVGLPEETWRSYDNPHAGEKRVQIIEPQSTATRKKQKPLLRRRKHKF